MVYILLITSGEIEVQFIKENTCNMPNSNAISQADFLSMIIPIMKEQGVVYVKSRKIKAREAVEGEIIITITQDGIETKNKAKPGDFVVENQTKAKEQYLIPGEKFGQRYVFEQRVNDVWSSFKPTGRVIAVQVSDVIKDELELEREFNIMASWGEKMVVKYGDMLVVPLDYSEVYRIAKQEFSETYKKNQ